MTNFILTNPAGYTVRAVLCAEGQWHVVLSDRSDPLHPVDLTPVEALVDARRIEADLEDPTLTVAQRVALDRLRYQLVNATASAIYHQVRRDGPRVLTVLAAAASWSDTGENL